MTRTHHPVPSPFPRRGAPDTERSLPYTTRGVPVREQRSTPPVTSSASQPNSCDCNGPCMCAVPIPLLRWFAAQVSVYHGPAQGQSDRGQCGVALRACGMCMLVTSLHRAVREHWQGILP